MMARMILQMSLKHNCQPSRTLRRLTFPPIRWRRGTYEPVNGIFVEYFLQTGLEPSRFQRFGVNLKRGCFRSKTGPK
jgi:hypothetical protein